MSGKWMIYGVTGFTGKLVVEEAVKRGHKPIVAGRNEEKVRAIAEQYQLPYQVVDLADTTALHEAVAAVDLVFHVAGPYVVTAEPMLQACLAGKTHYVDITGEGSVFARVFELMDEARQAGISLVSGIGFDVIPTDCLIRYVAEKIDSPDTIQMAIAPHVKPSAGTAKSALGVIANGKAEIRENGSIRQVPFGSEYFEVNFPSGKKTVSIGPIADVYTAHYSTGAGNIKTYMAQPAIAAIAARFMMPLMSLSLSSKWLRKRLDTLIENKVHGPDAEFRAKGSTEVWARVSNAKGDKAEAYLRTGEVYDLTAKLSIRFVEHVLAKNPQGSLAPAQLFPMADLLAVDGVFLFDEQHKRVLVT